MPTGSPVSPVAIARDRRFFLFHNCDAQFVIRNNTLHIRLQEIMLLNINVPQSV